jgi:hypothetical protein
MPKKPTKWPREAIPFKIELTGHATGPLEDNLTLLLEVMRTIARDFRIIIDYPAMIYLDDLEETNPPHPQGVREARGGYEA